MLVKVTKYTSNDEIKNYGMMESIDAMKLVKGYEYDKELDMWFSKKANVGYSIEEVK